MICLYCGKPIKDSTTVTEWHNNCIKHFFNTKELPKLDLSDKTMEGLTLECIGKGYTVTGVQKKLSLHLSSEKKTDGRLTLVGYPLGYILKPQTAEYTSLPEAECLVMQMAKNTGIKTVPFALIRLESGNFAYITKRIDRTDSGEKLAMEDFCQLDLRLTSDKYKGSYERCGKIIKEYAENPLLDISEFYLRIVFSFVVGNSDMHLKNFSLIETSQKSGLYRLSEAYDMLPVNTILPQDTDQMALTLNGKKRNLHRSDFLALADNLKLNDKVSKGLINRVISLEDTYLEMCKNSFMPSNYIENLCNLISLRIEALKPNK